MTETKSFAVIHNYAYWTGTISGDFAVTWTGDLQAAQISGVIHADMTGVGTFQGVLRLNGNEFWRGDMIGPIAFFNQTINADVRSLLLNGNNRITFEVVQTWGAIAVTKVSADLDMAMTSTGTISPPPPVVGGVDWTTILLAALALIAVIAIAGVAIRWKE